jgi:hypothetical protein
MGLDERGVCKGGHQSFEVFEVLRALQDPSFARAQELKRLEAPLEIAVRGCLVGALVPIAVAGNVVAAFEEHGRKVDRK